MIAVTGGAKDSAATNPTYYIVSYFGGLYSMGDNRQKQCGDFTTSERRTWVKARFSSAAADTFKNVSSISVQEHTAAFPAIAVITDTGNLYSWGDNSSNMLGSATAGNLDPQVPGGFTPGTDKALFAETGGHTLVYVKQGSTQFCYVGHAVSGSAGNTDNTTYPSFNCTATPVVSICGSVPVIPSTATSTISASPTSIVANGTSTSTITIQLKTAAGVNLTASGGVVGVTTTAGTVSVVTDNNDGTYTATLTSSATVTAAVIGFTINGYTATNTGTVNFTTIFCAPAITGSASMCAGSSVTLSNSSSGGTWTSSTTAVGTISSSGVVSGLSSGTTTITYTLASGCLASVVVTVNAGPAAIGGTLSACTGGNATLTNSTSGGTWTSGTTSVATVGSSSGIVAAVSAGTSAITYTLSAGCTVSAVFTVNSAPSAISGVLSACVGGGTTLSNATSGGTWNSGTTSVATIGSASGVVAAVAVGTSNITYTYSGCSVNAVYTVNAVPAAIGGTLSACTGGSAILTNSTSGGTWTSGTTSVATVGSSSGVVAAVSSGTSAITYTLSSGCSVSAVFTVNSAPSAITGVLSACVGGNTTLSNTTSGGTWSSGTTSVATIGSASGVVAAVAAGTSNITYTYSGCSVNAVYTVNALTAAITGTLSACVGGSASLGNTTSGGTWISAATSVATVGSSTGTVAAVAAGTSRITYTISGGCFVTAIFTVNAIPSAIAGSLAGCQGATSTLTNATSGGTWVSGSVSVATIGSASGMVSAVASGTSTISYTLSGGCATGAVFTVNAVPASISGTLSSCIGSGSTLTNTTSGGTWSSSTPAVATVGSATGSVAAVSVGTSNITYTLSTGCFATTVYTVNSLSSANTGTLSACVGGSSTLANTSTGGTWSSANTSVATIGSASGVVTAVAAGTSTVTYTSPSGCSISSIFTVNALPAALTGSLSACAGSTTALSSTTAGGTWSSSNTSVATVGTNGVVNGLLAGNATITYTAVGCYRTTEVTVGVVPATISGTQIICYNQTSTLSSTPSGQTWTSGNTLVATVNPTTGVVYGVALGTANITYTHSNSCYTTAVVTVSTGPNTGDNIVCVGFAVTLSNATTGGTWSSSNSNATVNIATGVVTGVTAGTADITYSVASTGCAVVTVMTVNPAMDTIAGQRFVCLGATSALSHTISGGAWSSSNTTVASVNSATGAVYDVSIGTATISYTVSSGCIKVTQVTVNSTLPAIVGYSYLCVGGGSRQFTHSLGGGTWSSSNTVIASVGSAGLVTPVGPGLATITYSLVSGCSVTFNVLVNLLPPSISGPSQMCVGEVSGLYSMIGGSATWSSSDISVATIGSGDGTITGVAPGTATITYAYYGCYLTRVQTVNAMPAAISGVSSMCAGQSTTFTTTPAGGTWTSSNTSVATVNSSTGLVTALIGGSAVISYIMPTGCNVATSLTIGNTPASITGVNTLCVGNTAQLNTTTTGGTWSSGDNTIATISAGGIVNGVSAGVTGITYTHPVSGCVRVAMITVNAAVAANVGNDLICEGGSTTLTNASGGGYWMSSNLSVATVNSSTGVVTAVTPGYANINYVVSSSCFATTNLTVNTMPAPVTGNNIVCQGYTTTLSHPVSGGIWSSNNTAIATVDATTGMVSGITLGPVAITYTTSSGCFRAFTVNVGVVPSPITGSGTLCTGSTTTLFIVAGSSGTWSSSDSTIATVNTYGTVTGLTAGNATITYTAASSLCYVTKAVTVNLSPAAITGNTYICAGKVDSSYACTPSGGTWSSCNTAAATINASSGVLTAITAGATNISYNLSTGCRSIRSATINAIPSTIIGTLTLCTGSASTLGSATSGATWSSSNTSIATVSTSGVVSGVSSGTATISYTNASGCANTAIVTVNNVPGAVSGNLHLCMGSTSALSNAATGGTWSSSNTAIASVGAATGLVTPVATGTANITYTVSGMGCYTVAQVTVNSALATITGTTNVCVGGTTTLSYSPAGGVWSSSDSSKATINSSTGVVAGFAPGTITITYSFSSACYKTATFTVKALPLIGGTAAVCAVASTTLAGAPTGGAWSSSDVSKAAISATSGLVNGVSAGTATISYLSAGCSAVTTFTVNQLPDSIAGSAGLCVAGTTTLAGYPSGGAWVSSVVAKATIGAATGVVTGVAVGTSVISYTLATGCRRTTIVTVGTVPNVITGTTNVCVGSATTLTTTTVGGAWSSANTAIATTGTAATISTIVTGIGVGTTTISYTALGCSRLTTVNVTTPLGTIVGDSIMCVGSASTLSTTATGGTWSSSNATIATVGSLSGLTSAIAGGSVAITYKTGPTCYTTKLVTVNAALAAITGNVNACVGYPTPFAHPVSGGVWSSSNAARATIDAATGILTGVSNGSVVITYTLSSGCYKTLTVIVNNLPLPITGTTTVCELNVTILSTVTGSSGTWSSASPSVATVAPTIGTVTGVASGTTTITYTAVSGCFVLKDVTVIPTPAVITGPSTVCVGSLITLNSATPGGTWSSNTPTAAVIGSTSGIVNAVSGGNAIMSYVMPNSCRRIMTITVNVQPAAITGPGVVCVDNSITLTSTTASQTWSSSNTSVATVGSLSTTTASVSPVAAGAATISYTNALGCSRTYVVTVNGSVPSISGETSVCTGQTVALSNTLTGGAWSSSSSAKASVGTTSAIVTGVSAGSAVITYLFSSGCYRTAPMSVNSSPAAITGLASVVAGSSTTFACATTGGTWSSSNTAIGSVNSTSGLVTGVSTGSMTISYILSSTGCSSIKSMTVNPAPLARGVVEEGIADNVKFAVFPNPSSGSLTIQSSVSGMFTVFTIDGKQLNEYYIETPSVTVVLPKELSDGIYMLRFKGVDGSLQVIRLIYKL